jgi:predicted RNA polymerase sigma factor
MREPNAPTRQTIETVWRIEAARLIGGLVRFVRSVDRAEDLAQEALLTALERWPETGIPDNPGAWLMTTAKNRAVDEGRRTVIMDAKHREMSYLGESSTSLDLDTLDEPVKDDVLRLILIACHPVLSKDARDADTARREYSYRQQPP